MSNAEEVVTWSVLFNIGEEVLRSNAEEVVTAFFTLKVGLEEEVTKEETVPT